MPRLKELGAMPWIDALAWECHPGRGRPDCGTLVKMLRDAKVPTPDYEKIMHQRLTDRVQQWAQDLKKEPCASLNLSNFGGRANRTS